MLVRSDPVILRRLKPDDMDIFLAYRADPEVARYQSWPVMTRAETERFLAWSAQAEPLLRPGAWTQIAVTGTGSDDLLGDMGLFLSETADEAEIGITLARRHHRQGIATAAMRAAIGVIFDTTSVTRIICGADRRNLASLAMIRRLGFRWYGTEDGPDGTDEMFDLDRGTWAAEISHRG